MDVPLDGVPFVADDEDDGVQVLADHGAEFLRRELEGAVAHEEDRASVISCFFGGERGALACAYRVADGTPEDLREGGDAGGEFGFPDAEVGGAGLGDDDVVWLQPLADAGPEPVVRDGLVMGEGLILSCDFVGGFGSWLDVQLAHFRDDLFEDALHAYAGVFGEFDTDVVAVEIDGRELADTVGKSSSIEI